MRLGCEDEPPDAKCAPSRSPSRVTAVTSGSAATSRLAAARSADDGDLEQQPAQRRTQRGRALDDVDRIADRVGQPGPGLVVDVGRPEHDAGTPEVLGLEVLDRTQCGVDVLGGDRVGRRAEGCRHRGLVAVADAEQRGDGAEQPGERVARGQQRSRPVLAVEAHLEGFLARRDTGALALGGLRLLAGLRQSVVEVGRAPRPHPRARRRAPPPLRRGRRSSTRGR